MFSLPVLAANRLRAGGGGDPDIGDVAMLLGFEGADASTSFTDESSFGHTLTAGGNAQIDTAQFKFGTSSALFDGNNDYIEAADNDAFAIGSNRFTIELFVRFATGGAITAGFCGQRGSTVGTSSFMYYLQSGILNLRYYSGTGTIDNAIAWSPAANTWYHICLERAADATRHYRDGVMIAKNTGTFNFPFNNSTEPFRVGTSDSFTTFDMNGHIDEFRFTNGVARYGSDAGFTVPTEAYPRP